MPTFTGKTFASFYKNILGMNQSSNTGVDATIRKVQDGAGNDTAIALSDDNLVIKPVNDNTAGTLWVQSAAGNNVFAVSTEDMQVKVNESQVVANTQYAQFGIHSTDAGVASFSADTHYAIPFTAVGTSSGAVSMGSSTSSSFNDTDPATSLTISTTAHNAIAMYWYVMDNITIDAVKWFHAADTATGEATAAHLMAYTVDTANGSTSGDLSSGVVVAGSSNITNAGYEQAYYQALTIESADVDAGKVILFTFASDTVNSDYSINATVKYHIR